MRQFENSNRKMEQKPFEKRVSPKNQKSRGNFILFAVLTIITGFFIFNSCKKEDKVSSLEVSPTSLQFDAGSSDYQTVNITSNVTTWDAIVNDNWCHLENGTFNEMGTNYQLGSGNGRIRIRVDQNTSAYSRSTQIEVRDEDNQSLVKKITVYQAAGTGGNNGGGGSTTLSVPTGVSASQNGSSISISWNAVSGATSYFVYRSSSATGTYSSLTSSSSTSATDASPMSGYNYYKVKASNGTTTSDYSSYAYVNYTSGGGGGGGTTTVPSAPTGVTATQSGLSVYVSWNSVSGATSYKLYRSSSATGTYSLLGSVSSQTYGYDNSPLSGDNYYKVTAVNSVGESAYSSYAYYKNGSSSGTKPNAPTSVSAVQSGSSINVSWSSVTGATSYKVYRSSSASGTYSQIGSPSSTNYTDSSPLSGYNYYKVSAVNSAGESSQSSYASCNYTAPVAAPKVPSSFVVADGKLAGINAIRSIILYPYSDKSTVDKYAYEYYVNGQAEFKYTNAPNTQTDSYGTMGSTMQSGSDYAIVISDPWYYKFPGTYSIKIRIWSGSQYVDTQTKSITIK